MTLQLAGIAASPGLAVGPIVRIESVEVVVPDHDDPETALTGALERSKDRLVMLSEAAAKAGNEEASDVLRAQSLMAEDPMLHDAVMEQLTAGAPFDDAISKASSELQAMLASLDDAYLAARAADIGEVVAVVRRELAGVEHTSTALAEPSVLIAEELTAAETAELDPDVVLGFATETGGATSHIAIIARSLGVPAVVGVVGLLDSCAQSSKIAIDGSSGELFVDPSHDEMEDFAERGRAKAELDERLKTFVGTKVAFGGSDLVVSANIGAVADIDKAVESGADGVGLFRTEFLFLDRPSPPTEDEQFEAYHKAGAAFGDTVVIRTFDIGGDKPAEFLDLAVEENPFLGERGVRIYPDNEDLFTSQIRAVLRASVDTKLALMVPMVATLSEFRWVRERIDAIAESMQADGIEIGAPAIGIMIEVPSVAVLAGRLAGEVDFFSIGTNDLTQYTMAADRGNGRLSALTNALHPAVLELCRLTVQGAGAHNVPVSVCGLAAADPVAAVIFAALGVEKLSVGANSVNLIKATIAAQPDDIGAAVLDALSTATSADEVRSSVSELIAQP